MARTTNNVPENDPPVFVFDGMNLAHTAFHAYQKLTFKKKSVSMIYGVPEIIRAFLQRYNPQRVVVVWDGDMHPERLHLLPTYKSHRRKNQDPKARSRFIKQIMKVRKILYALGIPQVWNKDIEGDDMMYLVVQRLKKSMDNCKIRVVSGDKDMLQMVDDRVWVEAPRIDSAINTVALFKAHTSLNFPKQHIDYLCLVGDDSDDIPGYLGIGPVKAREFLDKWGSIEKFLAKKSNIHRGIKRKRLRRLWKRNRTLIDLEYFCKKQKYTAEDITYYRDKREPLFNEERFITLCKRYGMNKFQMPSFQAPFKKLT